MKTFQKPLSKEEESLCIQALQAEDAGRKSEAKRLLIERNLRLVAHIAKKYDSSEEVLEDLISIGSIGLVKAVEAFGPQKKSRLAAYGRDGTKTAGHCGRDGKTAAEPKAL